MRGAPQVRIVRRLEPVPAQPGHPDVVGVQRDNAHAAEQEQPLTAHKDGTVTGLAVEVGQTVSAGAAICELAD